MELVSRMTSNGIIQIIALILTTSLFIEDKTGTQSSKYIIYNNIIETIKIVILVPFTYSLILLKLSKKFSIKYL